MKRLLASLIIILSLCGCEHVIPIAQAYSVSYNETTSYTYEDIDTLIELIAEQISIMDAAHQMAEAARQLGYKEDHEVIILAQVEYEEAEKMALSYQVVLDDLLSHWHQKEEEYPVASYIWNYLKNLGYNEAVRAGILGNIMTECGGHTLAIDVTAQTSAYWGMCQWNKTTYPEISGSTSVEEQCDYLRDTIEYELDTFGYLYSRGFTYQDFLNLEDVKEAAQAFAKCYERGPRGSNYSRRENAVVAYNYFIS